MTTRCILTFQPRKKPREECRNGLPTTVRGPSRIRRAVGKTRVFHEDFVREMKRKYERFPLASQRPLVANIAIEKNRAGDRARIEEWVGRIAAADQAKIIRLIRNPKHFAHTYGELAAAQVLIDSDCEIRYEQRLNGPTGELSPDWYGRFDGTHFICEVFTAGLLDAREAHEKALSELINRLSSIPAPFVLRLEAPAPFLLDSTGQKKLCKEIASWFSSGVQVSDCWTGTGCAIEVIDRSSAHLKVIAIDEMHVVPTPVSISETIREKARKYRVLGLPLLIVAVRHYQAEADQDMFEDAVLGALVHRSWINPKGDMVTRVEREQRGGFDGRPELSASLWLNPYLVGGRQRLLLTNPAATYPLPDRLITRLSEE